MFVFHDSYEESRPAQHRVGDPVKFAPYAFAHPAQYHEQAIPYALDGAVVYVNEAHRYYVAEAELYGYRIREAYKF